MCRAEVHLRALALGFLQEEAHLGHLVLGRPQAARPMQLTLQCTDCLYRLADMQNPQHVPDAGGKIA